jgi:hypothetical protein
VTAFASLSEYVWFTIVARGSGQLVFELPRFEYLGVHPIFLICVFKVIVGCPMVLVCHGGRWCSCGGREVISLVCVEDIAYVGDRCGDGEVGVRVPVVGSSALGLSELICLVGLESELVFGLGGLLGPVSEFPIGVVYSVNFVFEPVGFVSPFLVHPLELLKLQ